MQQKQWYVVLFITEMQEKVNEHNDGVYQCLNYYHDCFFR